MIRHIERFELPAREHEPSREVYVLYQSPQGRWRYENEHTEFRPPGWVRVDGVWYPLVYKIVTQELRSLGLRKNPNILQFGVNLWTVLKESDTVPGEGDWGGIWATLKRSRIREYNNESLRLHGKAVRGFLAAAHHPLFTRETSGRIKMQGIMLLSEVL